MSSHIISGIFSSCQLLNCSVVRQMPAPPCNIDPCCCHGDQHPSSSQPTSGKLGGLVTPAAVLLSSSRVLGWTCCDTKNPARNRSWPLAATIPAAEVLRTNAAQSALIASANKNPSTSSPRSCLEQSGLWHSHEPSSCLYCWPNCTALQLGRSTS